VSANFQRSGGSPTGAILESLPPWKPHRGLKAGHALGLGVGGKVIGLGRDAAEVVEPRKEIHMSGEVREMQQSHILFLVKCLIQAVTPNRDAQGRNKTFIRR